MSAAHRRFELVDALRRRVVDGLASGSLHRGQRLPSAREIATEIGADPRVVLAAYHVLDHEGVVEIRRRSGVYVPNTPRVSGGPDVAAVGWLGDVLAEAVEHGVAATRFGDWVKRCTSTCRVRAAVVADTVDMLESFCDELRDCAVDTVPFLPEAIDRPGELPAEILGADFVVASPRYAERLRALLLPWRKRVVDAAVRSRLDSAWHRMLSRGTVYVVLVDPRSLECVDGAAEAERAGRIRRLVMGRDDVRQIPPDANVYVTRSARRRIGYVQVPGRLIPTERCFTGPTMREVLRLVVAANLRSMAT